MIRTVADFLAELLRDNLPLLDTNEVSHAPTIGAMYEGLSSDLLARAIPEGLDLQVVSGFASDGEGNLSRQLDCMVVRGDGDRIPYTDSFVWNVEDIIAVVEVKKNLRGAEMADAHGQLQSLFDLEYRHQEARAKTHPEESISDNALRAFSETTRRVALKGQIGDGSVKDQMIFNVLAMESMSIPRIILGLHGYKSERAFRGSLIRLIEKNIGVPGFSPDRLPQLIISGNYSLVKANGRPFTVRTINDNKWPFYLSSPINPLQLLLEVIWTRLDEIFKFSNDLWGDDLQVETLHPMLVAKAEPSGWHYWFVDMSNEQLASDLTMEPWRPSFLGFEEFVVLQRLCAGQTVSLDDESLAEFLSTRGVTPEIVCDKLLATGLVALQGRQFELIALQCDCVLLPTGEYVAAENNTGRLTRWVMKYMSEYRSPK